MNDKQIIRALRAIIDVLDYIQPAERDWERDELNKAQGGLKAIVDLLEELAQ